MFSGHLSTNVPSLNINKTNAPTTYVNESVIERIYNHRLKNADIKDYSVKTERVMFRFVIENLF